MGMPVTDDREGMTRWRYGLQTLAAFPHVAVKLSGWALSIAIGRMDAVRPFLLEAIDIFGTAALHVRQRLPDRQAVRRRSTSLSGSLCTRCRETFPTMNA